MGPHDCGSACHSHMPFTIVCDDILIADMAVSADFVEWGLATLQQLHQERVEMM